MKLKIIGSGGMSIIPSSFCKCEICEEAREKGGRYERLGPSLYIDDIKMLIETPEDIAVACNRQKISEVKTFQFLAVTQTMLKVLELSKKSVMTLSQRKIRPLTFMHFPK